MKIVQEQILFDCLEQFEAGASVEELVAKYPHATAEIEKFLAVATYLQQMRLQPGLAAKQQSQKLFLQAAASLRADQRRSWFSWHTVQRTLLPVASLAMVTVLFAITLFFASASALPGDLLYGTKLLVESYRLGHADDATAVFNLDTEINMERMREVKAILRTQETAEVTFEGVINTKQGRNWIIAGVSVKINEQTIVEGEATVGATVLVNGRTQNGHLYASRITVLQAATPSATPTETETVLPTQTATTTAMPSKTPTATGTHGPTATATATKTPVTTTPMASATPMASSTPAEMPPTPTQVPPTATTEPTSMPTAVTNNNDNNNDNDDGNGNDNSGGDNENENDNNNNDNDDSGGGNSGSNNNDNSRNDNDNDNDDNDNDNGGGDNDNDNDDNGNENGRRDDD